MIKKIEFLNDPILGSKSLSLEKKDGTAYQTVVIAGVNGSGKTTFIDKFKTLPRNPQYGSKLTTSNMTIVFDHESPNLKKGNFIYVNNFGSSETSPITEFRTEETIRSQQYKKYNPKVNANLPSELNAQQVKELILNLINCDNRSIGSAWKKHNGEIIDDSLLETPLKLDVLQDSINNFFKKTGVDLNIDFNKDQSEWLSDHTIDSASSGEKQIIMLGAKLLIDVLKAKNDESIYIFIDEIEAFQHPQWQSNIITFIKSLVKDRTNVQFFITTHSPFILQSIFNENDTVIFNFKPGINECEKLTHDNSSLDLAIPTVAEINYLIFDVVSIELLDLLISKIYDDYGYKFTDESSYLKSNPQIGQIKINNFEISCFSQIHKSNQDKWWHKSYISFIRNYYHHYGSDFDQFISNLDNYIDATTVSKETMLKTAIDECIKIINPSSRGS